MLRWVALLLAVLLAGLQYKLWLADGGVPDLWEVRDKLAAQEQRIVSLKERNRMIEAEVIDLKTGFDVIEARARSELGLIGEGEVFFQVIEPIQPDATTTLIPGAIVVPSLSTTPPVADTED